MSSQTIFSMLGILVSILVGIGSYIPVHKEYPYLSYTILYFVSALIVWVLSTIKEEEVEKPKSFLSFLKSPFSKQKKISIKKVPYFPRLQKNIKAILIGFVSTYSVILVGVLTYSFINDSSEPTDYLVLIADFEDPENVSKEKGKRGVEVTLYKELSKELDGKKNYKIERLKKYIENKEEALKVGRSKKAKAILWGTYHVPQGSEEAWVVTHYEFIEYKKNTENTPTLKIDKSSQEYSFRIEDLKSFTIEKNIYEDSSYVLYLTLGSLELNRKAYIEAEGFIQKAYKLKKETSSKIKP
jgi:hypothetical protein